MKTDHKRASLLFLNQFYWPDIAATGQLLQDLCEDLSSLNYKITVICARAAYVASRNLPCEEIHRGVRILRTGPAGIQSVSALHRVWGYLAFYVASCYRILTIKKPDIILVESTPPLIVMGAAFVSFLRRIPLVHIVQDIYPEIAESVGTIRRKGSIARVLHVWHAWALRRTRRLIVLGRDMEEVLAERYGIDPFRMTIIPNWADSGALRYTKSEVDLQRAAWGFEGKNVVMYSGNLGRAHLINEIVQVAERWKHRDDVVFLFVGGGKGWLTLRYEIARRRLRNIILKPYQDRSRLGIALAVGDVHLITQKPETTGLVVPSKLYGVMAVGRPIVFVGKTESEVARTLTEAQAGIVVYPKDVDDLEIALENYLSDADLAKRASEAGLSYMRAKGDRKARTSQYADLIQQILKGPQ